MDIKVSLIVIVDELCEEYLLKDCFNSLINQTLKDIEIICVSKYELNILDSYSKKDERIKITFSNDNLKKTGIDIASGEYVSFIHCHDWVDFDFCKLMYSHAKEVNSDISLFKLLECNNQNLTKNYYYNFFNFDEELFGKPFSNEDISDILFSIPQEVYNKFYKTEFIKSVDPFFLDNFIFEDSFFFFKTFLMAKKISIFNDFIYFKRIRNNDKSIHKFIFKDLIDSLNLIFDLFKELNYFEFYKCDLINYKITLIRYWFSFINESYRKANFDYIRHDFINLGNIDKFCLESNNEVFYRNIIITPSYDEFKLRYIYMDSIGLNNDKINRFPEINDIGLELDKSADLDNGKSMEYIAIIESAVNDLIINEQILINNYQKQVNELNEIINNNSIKIANLGDRVKYSDKRVKELTLINDELNEQLNNNFKNKIFKLVFK